MPVIIKQLMGSLPLEETKNKPKDVYEVLVFDN